MSSINIKEKCKTQWQYKCKIQWQLVLLALSFFTRIPVTFSCTITSDMLHQASRYFALIGFFIGLLCSAVYFGASLLFDSTIAVLLMMAANLLLTGAFHEDGWADVWDGFGGGWQVTDKLNIMKDSRLGTYGAAALFIILLLKFESLSLIAQSTSMIIIAIILAQTLSRVVATSLIVSMNYVSEDASSKVKPLAQHMSKSGIFILLLTGVMTLLLAVFISCGYAALFPVAEVLSAAPQSAATQVAFSFWHALALAFVLIILRQLLIKWFNRQLGGYTGDCLGAAQQISEIVVYLFLLASMSVTSITATSASTSINTLSVTPLTSSTSSTTLSITAVDTNDIKATHD